MHPEFSTFKDFWDLPFFLAAKVSTTWLLGEKKSRGESSGGLEPFEATKPLRIVAFFDVFCREKSEPPGKWVSR